MDRLRPLISVGALALIAAMVIATQVWTLKAETLDWDEQTFLLMAQDVLRGHLPYVSIFDNKPPLLFFLLAGAMALFGQNIETLRWLGMLCVFLGAAIVYAVAARRLGAIAAIVVGLVYVAAHAVGIGLYTSSEVIANVFVAAAMWALLVHGERQWASWAAGALLALAILTRTNLVFDAAAIGLIYVVAAIRPDIVPLRRYGIIGFALSGLLVLAALLMLYASQDGLDELWLATVVVPLSYIGNHRPGTIAGMLVENVFPGGNGLRGADRVFLILALAAALMAAAGRSRLDLLVPMAILAATAVSILVGSNFHTHYMLQFYPAAGMLIACAVGVETWRCGILAAGAALVMWLGLAPTLASSIDYLPHLFDQQQNRPRLELAGYLAAERSDSDQVWALIDHVILFYLDLPPISRAGTHPENILRGSIIRPLVAAGYVGPDEFERILASRPRYIVASEDGGVWYLDEARLATVKQVLASDYLPAMRAEGTQTVVFRRHDDIPAARTPPVTLQD